MFLEQIKTLGIEDRGLVEGSYVSYRAKGLSHYDAGLKALTDFHKCILTEMDELRAVVRLSPIQTTKSVEWQGLTLSREPNAFESALDLKGISDTYDSEKQRLTTILLNIRNTLIKQASEAVTEHDASTIYQLILTPPPDAAKKLRKEIENAVDMGRAQVASELGKQGKSLESKDKKKKIAEWISELVDLLIARTVSEIQKRAQDIFTSLGTLGLDKTEIVDRIEQELGDQSMKAFESFASQTANAAINTGRDEEAANRQGDWNTVEYSAILDKNTCSPCEDADGQTATDPSDLPDAPNPDCEGGAQCRCFHVYIYDEGNA